jgi:hypothetical protein
MPFIHYFRHFREGESFIGTPNLLHLMTERVGVIKEGSRRNRMRV